MAGDSFGAGGGRGATLVAVRPGGRCCPRRLQGHNHRRGIAGTGCGEAGGHSASHGCSEEGDDFRKDELEQREKTREEPATPHRMQTKFSLSFKRNATIQIHGFEDGCPYTPSWRGSAICRCGSGTWNGGCGGGNCRPGYSKGSGSTSASGGRPSPAMRRWRSSRTCLRGSRNRATVPHYGGRGWHFGHIPPPPPPNNISGVSRERQAFFPIDRVSAGEWTEMLRRRACARETRTIKPVCCNMTANYGCGQHT